MWLSKQRYAAGFEETSCSRANAPNLAVGRDGAALKNACNDLMPRLQAGCGNTPFERPFTTEPFQKSGFCKLQPADNLMLIHPLGGSVCYGDVALDNTLK